MLYVAVTPGWLTSFEYDSSISDVSLYYVSLYYVILSIWDHSSIILCDFFVVFIYCLHV